jgi:DNA-binding response OmpR family regulator
MGLVLRPVRRGDLSTRVAVLLRQAYATQVTGEKLTFGQYSFEPGIDRATIAGKAVDLTKKEFEPGLLFFRNLGQPISRATIIDSVRKGITPALSRTVDTHMSRVRSKLELPLQNGFRLSPVYSFGYQLDALKTKDTD